MTRSKLRKIRRQKTSYSRSLLRSVPLASALLAGAGVVQAQQAEEQSGGLDEIVVTATKTQQNLQDVPLSIQAIGTERLEELGVQDFDDYVKFLPSVSYQSAGPGFARVFMRGAASGDNGNHSGPQPGVGQYLDEQPITTIQGALDIHMYDIARVESLAGPQGTLYGASSQSGTIRIITNKPQADAFDASFSLEGNSITDGDQGYLAEGMVNVPLGEKAAIRMVGWARHDAGYIDNIPATRTFTTGFSQNSLAEDNYNDSDTYGARIALKVDLNDNWSITPTIMGQKMTSNGVYAQESGLGELQVAHWHPEESDDRWTQAALTLEGKISNFDLTFAGSYLKREVDVQSDYSDYSFFYDSLLEGFGSSFVDDNGDLINPSQFIQGKDGYTKWSTELRIASPAENRVRFVAGLFAQRQTHDIQQDYKVTGLAADLSVTGWEDTLWLTKQYRIDRDSALFGEVTFDATDKLSFLGGVRFFRSENSLEGFFGFNGYEEDCTGTDVFEDGPCQNLHKDVKDNDKTFKFNATYHITDDAMVYATYSEGFRPGGVNRRGTFPPYKADFLTNYEIGWKTSWANDKLRFNGTIFHGDWDDFQFSFLGENGLTNVSNAGGATLEGIEMDLQWAVTESFSLYGGLALQKAEMSEAFCVRLVDPDADPEGEIPVSLADCSERFPGDFVDKGTRLPITPRFKGSLTGRYEFDMGGLEAHLQGSVVSNGSSRSALLESESQRLGDQESYTIADMTFGVGKDKWSAEFFVNNVFDERAALYRYTECISTVCAHIPGEDGSDVQGIVYSIVNRPRTIGLRFSQKF
jgi:iron complex outermembrane recepter protein